MNGRLLLLLLLLPLATVSAQTVVLTLDAPDTNISGLAYGGGSLWAVDGTTNYLYKLNPSTGAVQGSWYVAPSSSEHPTGLGFGNNQLYIAHTNSYIKIYTTSGVYSSQFTVSC